FLEPKGDDRLQVDEWKENLLRSLNNDKRLILEEDASVRLIGIKFFADSKMDEFIKDLEEKLNDGLPLEERSLSLF
ncbi:hypothetical protein ACW2P0_004874, partial [Escherichia coli]